MFDVPEGTLLCAVPAGGASPSETFASLIQVMVAADEYPLPIEATTPYTLPICLRGREGPLPAPVSGNLRYMMFTSGDTTYRRWWADRSIPDGTLSFRIAAPSTESRIAIERAPSLHSPTSIDVAIDGAATNSALFVCGGTANQFFSITHARGSVSMSVRVVTVGVAGGVPSGFMTSATGTLDGQSFTEDEYWNVVYMGGHHGWVHGFLIRFDEPIGTTCGLSIRMESYPDPSGTVTLLDCALEPGEMLPSIAVSSTG
jgi:hypothetical protein